jgi:flagellar motor switch protein FliM
MADEKTATPPPGQSDKTEDQLLDEWLNMAASQGEAEGAAAPVVEERILDQNEIDSLLGIDKGTDQASKSRGIRALLDSNVISYERLPLLEIIFDRFERLLSTSLRQFTADNVDITIENITSVRFGEYLNNIPLPAGLVVVKAVGLDDYILVVYESRLIYAVVDILLGGRKARPAKIEGRSFTTIERNMVENLSEVVLNELGESFSPVAPIKFQFERMESNPRFAAISREGNAAILVTVRVNLEERDGVMQFCMPYATLEPIREQLLQQFMGEKFGHDNIWENHLAQELYHTNVELQVVLDEKKCSLNDVLNWKLGQTVLLNAKPNTNVRLKCGGIVKMIAAMGKAGDTMAVKILRNVSDINNERGQK